MFENCVSFTGHRQAPYTLRQPLERVIELLFHKGYTTFLSGMALGFDMLAAEAVLRAKNNHPEIKLIAVLPFPQQSEKFSPSSKSRYQSILQQADNVVITSNEYTNAGVYHIRNKYLVEHCSVIVSYYNNTPGGTQKTIEMGRKIGLPIISINPE
jgi:uncharacterized phage-like protein YoqJ